MGGKRGEKENLSGLLIKVNILEKNHQIYPGGSVLVETEIILLQEENAGSIHDILIEYTLKDHTGSVVSKVIETKGGRDRITAINELVLSSDTKPGIYFVEVKASKGNVQVMASATFEVVEKLSELKNEGKIRNYAMLVLVVFNLLLIFAIFFLAGKHRFR